MAEHNWVDAPLTRGKRKGEPGPQRRCENCALWETELSRAHECRPADGAPFGFDQGRR